jgi:hypothetical protein
MKLKLTAEQKAQILAGNEELDLPDPVTPSAAEGSPAASAKPEPAAPAKPEPAAEVLAFLRGQLADKDTALIAANVKIATLEAAAAGAADAMPKLVEIVQGVVGNMQVALGGTDTAKALGAKALVEEHARVQPVYAEKFKVGGLAVRSTEAEDKPAVHPLFQQRLASLAGNK